MTSMPRVLTAALFFLYFNALFTFENVPSMPSIRLVSRLSVEVMVVVAAVSGQHIDPVELLEFLKPRMPYFMIPRYIRFIDTLPMTASQKVKKTELRAEGITPDCWDREEAGIVIKREKIG